MWHLKKFRNVAKGTQKSVLWVTSASVGQQGSSRYIEKTKLPHVVLMYGPMSMGDGGPHLCFSLLKSNLVIIMKFFTDGIHNANYDFYIFLQVVIPCFCQEASTVSRSNLAFLSAFLRPSSANMDGCSTFVKQPYVKKRG